MELTAHTKISEYSPLIKEFTKLMHLNWLDQCLDLSRAQEVDIFTILTDLLIIFVFLGNHHSSLWCQNAMAGINRSSYTTSYWSEEFYAFTLGKQVEPQWQQWEVVFFSPPLLNTSRLPLDQVLYIFPHSDIAKIIPLSLIIGTLIKRMIPRSRKTTHCCLEIWPYNCISNIISG